MVFLQDLIQVLAFDVGHGDELHAAGFGQVVDAQNVLVGNTAGEQQLASLIWRRNQNYPVRFETPQGVSRKRFSLQFSATRRVKLEIL